MSRDDLLATNKEIVGERHQGGRRSARRTRSSSSSPTRSTRCATSRSRSSGFPRQRVVGMAGMLDSARFRTFLAWELGVSAQRRHRLRARRPRRHDGARSSATPTSPASRSRRRSTQTRLDEIVQRTRDGGAEVVKLLKAGSAPTTRPPPRSPRWSTRSCSTRSACCRAPPTATASTASTACSSACRSSSAPRASRRSSRSSSRTRRREALQKSAGAVRELVDAMAKL